jgi:hypothetical protein
MLIEKWEFLHFFLRGVAGRAHGAFVEGPKSVITVWAVSPVSVVVRGDDAERNISWAACGIRTGTRSYGCAGV